MARAPTRLGIVPNKRPRRLKDFEPASKPFTFLALEDHLNDQAWREAITLLQNLAFRVRHQLAAGVKPKSIIIDIGLVVDDKWDSLEEVLAVCNFRFGWSLTSGTFPELALMRAILPDQIKWNRKREWAASLKKVRRRGKKTPEEALRGGVYAATRLRDPKPTSAKLQRPLRS